MIYQVNIFQMFYLMVKGLLGQVEEWAVIVKGTKIIQGNAVSVYTHSHRI